MNEDLVVYGVCTDEETYVLIKEDGSISLYCDCGKEKAVK